MRTIILLFFFCICSTIHGQKEDYVWFLGKDQSTDPGIQGMMIDWNRDTLQVVRHDLAYGIDNNNASICDEEGNLLFWSNGCAVMNKNQEVMPNGDTLNWDRYREEIGWGDCKYGYFGVQNLKILPDPGNDSGYYIIHKTRRYYGQGIPTTYELRQSYVDMTLDGGLGDVVYVDSTICNENAEMSNLEAIYAENGRDWWVLQPIDQDSVIMTFLVDAEGIHRQEDQNAGLFFAENRGGGGTTRMSPDGTKLAYYAYLQNLHVYDFDRSTGKISNHQKVRIFDDAESMPNNKYRFGSVEWSPNSRFMYVAVLDSLFQVDSWEQDMEDGISLIDTYNGTLDPFPTTFYTSTLAPDCKIYICSTSGSGSYHVIHHPDELGTACDFEQNGLKLPQFSGSANLPLFPRFRVDEEDKCDTSIVSVFGESVFYRRDLEAYPIPAYDKITIKVPDGVSSGHIAILDVDGRLVYEKALPYGTLATTELDVSSLAQGVYFVELYPYPNHGQVFYNKKILKVR